MDGCVKYVKAYIDINFEENHVDCDHCPLLITYSRKTCGRTGELVVNPSKTVGYYCPLVWGDSGSEFLNAIFNDKKENEK